MSETQFMTSIQADFGDEDSKYSYGLFLLQAAAIYPTRGAYRMTF
jgi:hypothetical protein